MCLLCIRVRQEYANGVGTPAASETHLYRALARQLLLKHCNFRHQHTRVKQDDVIKMSCFANETKPGPIKQEKQ